MQNKITEILNDNTTTNEEKGKDIGPVRAAYEEIILIHQLQQVM